MRETVVNQLKCTEAEMRAFCREVEQLRLEIMNRLGDADVRHLEKIQRRGRLCTIAGYAWAWAGINPIAAFLISFGHFTRWLLAHHILHKGYDRVPNIPEHYTSKRFAQGRRRFIDWFDWIHPTAWHHEHNILHHYHTGEDADPDLVERHVQFLRNAPIPKSLKRVFVILAGMTWKYTYYAPNTISVLDTDALKSAKRGHAVFLTIKRILDLRNRSVRTLWMQCYLPYGFVHFAIIPLLFLPLGTAAAWAVLMNKIIAECLTNLHSFLIIGPNHTGRDLCRYDFHFRDKDEFYVTQVLGTANYRTGNDLIDHLQIWLNYQIEHHLFPDIPMSQYQWAQPRVKALCERYGIPYVQENVFTRFRKMVAVCVGDATMKRVTEFGSFERHRSASVEAEARPA